MKIEILEDVLAEYNYEDKKSFIDNLKYIQKFRNAFAHTKPKWRYERDSNHNRTKYLILQKVDRGKFKTSKLDEDDRLELKFVFSSSEEQLDDILDIVSR